MVLKVLGSGCANCERLERATKCAAAELGIDATIEKVTDVNDILSYGVMMTPALVVNDKVVLAGRVASVGEIKKILQAY